MDIEVKGPYYEVRDKLLITVQSKKQTFTQMIPKGKLGELHVVSCFLGLTAYAFIDFIIH